MVVGVSCSVVGPKRYERWGVGFIGQDIYLGKPTVGQVKDTLGLDPNLWTRASSMWLLREFGILLFCSPGFWDVGGLLRALSSPGG